MNPCPTTAPWPPTTCPPPPARLWLRPGDQGRVALDNPLRPSTRQVVLNRLIPGEAPKLTDLRYVVCFSATTDDAHDHKLNWVCLDDPDHCAKIRWVAKNDTMSVEDRLRNFVITTTSPEGQKERLKYHTFCRVELGEFIYSVFTTSNLLCNLFSVTIPGCNDKLVEYYVDNVILTLLNEWANGKTAQEAYAECCKRYPDCMRAG